MAPLKDRVLLGSGIIGVVSGLASFLPKSLYIGASFLLIMVVAFAVFSFRLIILTWARPDESLVDKAKQRWATELEQRVTKIESMLSSEPKHEEATPIAKGDDCP